MTDYSGPCPYCADPDAVQADGTIPEHDVHGLTSPCDAPPTLPGCSHGICLPLAGDGCHLDGAETAGQVLDRLDRHALIADMTDLSVRLGLYDIPAADYPPKENR